MSSAHAPGASGPQEAVDARQLVLPVARARVTKSERGGRARPVRPSKSAKSASGCLRKATTIKNAQTSARRNVADLSRGLHEEEQRDTADQTGAPPGSADDGSARWTEGTPYMSAESLSPERSAGRLDFWSVTNSPQDLDPPNTDDSVGQSVSESMTGEGAADMGLELERLAGVSDGETDEALSDIESHRSWRSGRASILPPIGRFVGVAMDLATVRANKLLQDGKDALERATNMRRDCKIEALECLQGLYETVLGVADSRSRHRVALEEERARAARELVRVERAHTRRLAEISSQTAERVTETQQLIAGLRGLVEGIQGWLNFEMDAPIKTIGSIHLELQRVAAGRHSCPASETVAGEALRAPRPALGPGLGPELLLLREKMEGLTDHFRALQVDVDKWRLELADVVRGRMSEGSIPVESVEPKDMRAGDAMGGIGRQLEMLREAVCRNTDLLEKDRASLPSAPLVNPSGDSLCGEISVAGLIRSLGMEIAEVKDLILARPEAPNIASDLGTELAITEAREMLGSTLKPLESKLDGLANRTAEIDRTVRTYAAALKSAPHCMERAVDLRRGGPGTTVGPIDASYGLIVESINPQHSYGDVIDSLRRSVDVVSLGVGVKSLRRIRRGRVVADCATPEERKVLGDAIKASNTGLSAMDAPKRRPLLRLIGVAHHLTDERVGEALLSQNGGLLGDVPEQQRSARVVRRVKGRTGERSNVVVEVSSQIWKALQGTKVRIGYQMVSAVDQSPVMQCYRCMGFGHRATECQGNPTCGYCSGGHDTRTCTQRDHAPKCANCGEAAGHPAYSGDCPVWQRWDRIARAGVNYC